MLTESWKESMQIYLYSLFCMKVVTVTPRNCHTQYQKLKERGKHVIESKAHILG